MLLAASQHQAFAPELRIGSRVVHQDLEMIEISHSFAIAPAPVNLLSVFTNFFLLIHLSTNALRMISFDQALAYLSKRKFIMILEFQYIHKVGARKIECYNKMYQEERYPIKIASLCFFSRFFTSRLSLRYFGFNLLYRS